MVLVHLFSERLADRLDLKEEVFRVIQKGLEAELEIELSGTLRQSKYFHEFGTSDF